MSGPRIRIAVQGKHHGRDIWVALGDGRPQMLNPASGWSEVTRPGKRSLTRYIGTPLFRASVPVVFDGRHDGSSVQAKVDRIIHLWRPRDPDEEPPVLRVHGPLPSPIAGKPVVLENIEPGNAESDESDRARLLYQPMNLILLEHSAEDAIEIKRRGSGGAGGWPIYETKKGDTIAKIAAKQLHGEADNARNRREYAHTLSILNDIRDKNRELEPGTKIRLPR